MINYPAGYTGPYASNSPNLTPYSGTPGTAYTGSLDYTQGTSGITNSGLDSLQLQGLTGTGTGTNTLSTANSSTSTMQILSMVVTLLESLIQNLTNQGQSGNGASAFDMGPSPTPVNASPPPPSSTDSGTTSNADTSTGTGTATNASNDNYLNFKQGQTGDCAVLSAIAAVSLDANGKKTLDNSVKDNGDGSYTVKLQGTGETFNISKDQMNDSKLSSGDPKVKALENAIKQHYANKGDTFEGKGGPDVIKLLTGKDTQSLKTGNDPAQLKQALIDLSKKDTNGLTLEVGAEHLTGSPTNGMHGYAVENINAANNTITYENPWDANKPVTISLDDFSKD
jgi:hypothetical protein